MAVDDEQYGSAEFQSRGRKPQNVEKAISSSEHPKKKVHIEGDVPGKYVDDLEVYDQQLDKEAAPTIESEIPTSARANA